jgi:soluble lytic murein transglycosylase-like protein
VQNDKNKLKRRAVATAVAALTVGGGAATAIASASDAGGQQAGSRGKDPVAKTMLEASVEVPQTRDRYRDAYGEAKKLDIEPKRNLVKSKTAAPAELHSEAFIIRAGVTGEKALQAARDRKQRAERQRERRQAQDAASAYGTPESVGVDQGTLDAIAACESGGDPTAVDPSGTYRGKYQFDMGTWASVGGSGDPAAAPEAEQDYRAALLLSQSGSSPWPVCGS